MIGDATIERPPVVVLGSGLFAEEVADLITNSGAFEIEAFVEGVDRRRCEETLMGKPIRWIDDLGRREGSRNALCAIGSTKRRNIIERAYRAGMQFVTFVHPSAQISPSVMLGEGTIVGPGAVVGVKASIGKHVIVNRGGLIGHHATLGDYVTVGPGANIAGKTRIAEQVYVGMSAVILDGATIGSRSVVGAAAVVTQSVPGHVQVVGNPARIVKRNIEGL